MKRFNRLIIWVIVVGMGLVVAFSFAAYTGGNMDDKKAYMIEVNRLSDEINNGTLPNEIELDKATYIRSLDSIDKHAERVKIEQFFNGAGVESGKAFIIKPSYHNQEISGYIRFSYDLGNSIQSTIIKMDIILVLALLASIGMLLYVKRQIIKPFHLIEDMPYELSKGYLNQGMKESKSRFFGRFIWGLDLLRESLISQKQTNLRLEKDRQTLVASLSHDLKTPVAAIKLYATALHDNLYQSEDKRKACAKLIGEKAEQIEKLVGDIITTSVSSISDLEIHNEEFYLSDWVKKVKYSNEERLSLLKINFQIESFHDKLLVGDLDKLVEVFDNIMDNAIKYGDGERIRVTFYEEDYRQLIRIENSGTPVSQNELPHIFTSFWRGSNAGSKQGNGLGLYISKQLLKKMNGDIYAETVEHAMAIVLVVRI